MSLAAEQVGYRAGGRWLLQQASLAIAPGEVHALLGRNGAGKSTLLRLLAGELEPETGVVRLNGRPLADWTPRQRARQRAVLAQSESLRFAFTVEQVVALGRYASRGHGPETEHRIVRQALQLAEADDLAGRTYTTLSGGERARVQLARVMAQIWEAPDPEESLLGGCSRYLLLDEPTASLDLAHQHGCLRQVRRFAAGGVGVLVVLHDPNLAMRYADRTTLLEDGRIIGQGPTRELLTRPLLERTYGVEIEVLERAEGRVPVVVSEGLGGHR